MKKNELVIGSIVLLSFFVSFYFYPQMPERLASHWNAQGQVDGYMAKKVGVFFMPFTILGIALLLTILPKIDPLKANLEQFRTYYDGFLMLFLLFLLTIHLQLILWNKGIRISPNTILPPTLGILFFYIGVLCENSRPNWFVGIRTPWTLSSEKVWEKTHKLGGKLFKIAGAVTFLGILFPQYVLYFIAAPVISVGLYTTIYSYLEYQKEKK